MAKIKAKFKLLFDTIVKSLTNFKYYKEVSKAKFTFSLKYLFGVYYILSLIGSIVFAVSISVLILPKIPNLVSTLQSKAYSYYPSGLSIDVSNGIVSTNQKEPYYLDSFAGINSNGNYDHLLTIDTNANVSDFANFKSYLLLTKDSFVTADSNNTYKVYPIDKTANFKIDQKTYNQLIKGLLPLLKYLMPLLIAIVVLSIVVWPFIVASFSLSGQLFYLLIFSLILFLLVKLMKKDLTFKKLYQLSMHASTLPILLGVIVATFGLHMPFLLGSAILFVFMILVLNQF